jgi:hypothetical protein
VCVNPAFLLLLVPAVPIALLMNGLTQLVDGGVSALAGWQSFAAKATACAFPHFCVAV